MQNPSLPVYNPKKSTHLAVCLLIRKHANWITVLWQRPSLISTFAIKVYDVDTQMLFIFHFRLMLWLLTIYACICSFLTLCHACNVLKDRKWKNIVLHPIPYDMCVCLCVCGSVCKRIYNWDGWKHSILWISTLYFICDAKKPSRVLCVRTLKHENSFSTKLNEQFPIKIIKVYTN